MSWLLIRIWARRTTAPASADTTRQRPSAPVTIPDIEDGVRHRRDEAGMRVDGGGADRRQSDLARGVDRLDVEVVQDFDVIAEETQRAEHHGAQSARALGAQVIAD